MDPGDALLGMDVPCDRVAPATVRGAFGQIEGVGPVLGDAMLVASELVSNAVLHSGCSASDTIEVLVTRSSRGLMISVRDPGYSGKEAQVSERDVTAVGGLGLRVVEAVAARWGAERDAGYRVWAELPTDARQAAERDEAG